MEAKRDYYEILGIPRNADAAAIKKAYRRLAKQYHPDTNAGNAAAEKRFKEITEAYTILSDEEKRKLYDQFGHAAFDGSAAQEPGGGAQGAYHFYGDGDMDDIFRDMFGDMFRGFGSGRQGGSYEDSFYRGGFSRRGGDLNAEVSVSFEEAAFGCEKLIRLSAQDGSVQSLKVHIPAGIETGKTIRLRGKGMAGAQGGEPGDLLLRLSVQEKPGFERKGMDVYTTARVPFSSAVLGGEVLIPTLYGTVACRLNAGTQSGTKLRLKGKGIVSMKDPGMYGDQYTRIEIEVPRGLSPESRQKLRAFEESLGVRRSSFGGGSVA